MSYCQADYTYDIAAGTGSKTRGWLQQLDNTYWWKDGQGQWQSRLLAQNVYTYDAAGMRLTNGVTVNGQSRMETYGYDELYRLTGVNYGDGTTQSYTFDPMGNRQTKVENGVTENYTYNTANMLLTRGATAYTNDPNGNTLTGGGRTSTWDSQNRLYQCVYNGNTTTHTYAADGLRHRTVQGANTTDYILDASMFVRELRNGTLAATYLIGPRGPEYRRDDQAGTIRWYCYDGLGSVLAEVDPAGNLTASRSYDVYGLVRNGQGGTSKHKFVGALGHPSEDETGLIYMRARYMDPQTGRFVNQDPGRNGQNWLVYCLNNPSNMIDPDGKMPKWLEILGLGIGILLAALGLAVTIIGTFAALAVLEVAVVGTAGAIVAAVMTLAIVGATVAFVVGVVLILYALYVYLCDDPDVDSQTGNSPGRRPDPSSGEGNGILVRVLPTDTSQQGAPADYVSHAAGGGYQSVTRKMTCLQTIREVLTLSAA